MSYFKAKMHQIRFLASVCLSSWHCMWDVIHWTADYLLFSGSRRYRSCGRLQGGGELAVPGKLLDRKLNKDGFLAWRWLKWGKIWRVVAGLTKHLN